MNKNRLFLLLVFFLTIHGYATHAQDSSLVKISDTSIINLRDSLKAFEAELDSLLHPKKSYFKIEVGFISNNVYFGRKDSIATPYITPQIGYHHKSGLYVNALASYLPTPGQNRFDLFTLEAGYNKIFGNLQMQLTANKFFYNSNSYNVMSEIKENFMAAFSYETNIITPVLEGSLIVADKTDFAGTFGLEHAFYAFNDHLDIAPSVVVNASTQNYNSSYYRFRRYALKRFRRPLNYTITAEVIDPEKFKVLDYEISLPVNYTAKKFSVSITPAYAIPVNPANLRVTRKIGNFITREKDHYEKLSESFFIQASISYKL